MHYKTVHKVPKAVLPKVKPKKILKKNQQEVLVVTETYGFDYMEWLGPVISIQIKKN